MSDLNTNVTTQDGLSAEMKAYYDTELLENVRSNLVFNQFAKTQSLPGGKGKKVEWRKFNTYAKATTPLTEGVTPDGETMTVTSIEAPVSQYGSYTTVSDVLDMTAVDDTILACTDEHSAQAALTLDTLTRNELMGGSGATNVLYAPNISGETETPVTSRADLTASAKLTPKLVNRAVTILKKANAPKINGKYVAIIHPSVAEDLRESSAWIEAHKYAAVTEIFNGEIGELHGVRFVETTESKIFAPAVISDGINKLTVKTAVNSSTTSVVVNEELTSGTYSGDDAIPVYVNGVSNTIVAITKGTGQSTLTLGTAIASLAKDAIICGKGAGKDGSAVYPCLFLGRDAYGTVDLEGAGLEMIVKPLGSAGSADPLNQRQTVGWKCCHGARILYPERMLRVEVGSGYSDIDGEN